MRTPDAAPSGAGSGAVLPDGGCPEPNVKPIFDGVRCLDRQSAAAECEAHWGAKYPGLNSGNSSCGVGCLCTWCAAELFQCSTDYSCEQIVQCAQESGCVGVACYLSSGGSNGPCKSIIDHADDDAGITGVGVGLAQLVMSCAQKTRIGNWDYSLRGGPVCPTSCP